MADINTTIKLQDRRALSAQPDTGVARLPGLVRPTLGDAAMARWVDAVSERLEVREGARGNDAERVVTQREIQNIAMAVNFLQDKNKKEGPDSITLPLGGGLTATLAIKKFEDLIRATKLYKDLKKRLDDPSRFDDLPQAVRDYVSLSLSEEAALRGTAITRVEKIINERYTSMAIQVDMLTSIVDQNAAGVRETRWAVSETNRAQAGKITQLEASLGNYYQDGTPGRALLEEQMTVTADRLTGLDAQYTLKVQAGGALAGFGIAATEVNGVPSSAFIIGADKFAIVNSATYSAGLTNTPDTAHIPFGVDANGIYMNHNVYVKGTMRVDTGGRRLIDGLRGSLALLQQVGTWNDATARQMIWNKLGNAGAPANNNHLVIGDTVTIGSATKTWNGSAWLDAGLFINGNVIVDGTVSASKVNTMGLIVRDQYGNPLLGAGYSLDKYWVSGLGSLASANDVRIGNQVKFPDGTTMNSADFVNRLSRINSGNIGVFMDGAAITNAYIGNLEVSTMKIQGRAVVRNVLSRGTPSQIINAGYSATFGSAYLPAISAGGVQVAIMGFVNAIPLDGSNGSCGVTVERILYRGGGSFGGGAPSTNPISYSAISMAEGFRTFNGVFAFDELGYDGAAYQLRISAGNETRIQILEFAIVVIGASR